MGRINEMSSLDKQFDEAMRKNYEETKSQIRYDDRPLMELLKWNSAHEAARLLLEAPQPSDGFIKLWENGRLDLSVEALVINPTFDAVCGEDLKAKARARLKEYHYS
jgi:hypothetical protein